MFSIFFVLLIHVYRLHFCTHKALMSHLDNGSLTYKNMYSMAINCILCGYSLMDHVTTFFFIPIVSTPPHANALHCKMNDCAGRRVHAAQNSFPSFPIATWDWEAKWKNFFQQLAPRSQAGILELVGLLRPIDLEIFSRGSFLSSSPSCGGIDFDVCFALMANWSSAVKDKPGSRGCLCKWLVP